MSEAAEKYGNRNTFMISLVMISLPYPRPVIRMISPSHCMFVLVREEGEPRALTRYLRLYPYRPYRSR